MPFPPNIPKRSVRATEASPIYARCCRADGLFYGEIIYRDRIKDELTTNAHPADRSLSVGWDYSYSDHGTAHGAAGGIIVTLTMELRTAQRVGL